MTARLWCSTSLRRKRVIVGIVAALGVYLVLSTALRSNGSISRLYVHQWEEYTAPISPTAIGHTGVQDQPASKTQGLGGSIVASSAVSDTLRADSMEVHVDPRVLLLYDKNSILAAKRTRNLLQAQRILYDAHPYNSNKSLELKKLPEGNVLMGKYSLILCVGLKLHRHKNFKEVLRYSKVFNVTMVTLGQDEMDPPPRSEDTTPHPLNPHPHHHIKAGSVIGVQLNTQQDFYYLRNSGKWMMDIPVNSSWTVIEFAESKTSHHIEVLAYIKYSHHQSDEYKTAPLVFVDKSAYEGVTRQIWVGSPPSFWLSKLLLLEIIRSESQQQLTRFGRERWVMIDIDDIFVAPSGLKMTPDDVKVSRATIIGAMTTSTSGILHMYC